MGFNMSYRQAIEAWLYSQENTQDSELYDYALLSYWFEKNITRLRLKDSGRIFNNTMLHSSSSTLERERDQSPRSELPKVSFFN